MLVLGVYLPHWREDQIDADKMLNDDDSDNDENDDNDEDSDN